MNEELEKIVFEIISNAGSAKSMAYEALELSKENKISEARKKLKEVDDYLLNAHHIQTDLISKEVRGEKVEISVLFIHAQDHLMSAIEIKNLISHLIDMNEKIFAK